MYWRLGMDVEKYLDHCKKERIFPRFKGIFPFQELLKRGRITPFVTTIRVMYSGAVDQCYCLDYEGMLCLINNPDNPPQKPEEVLGEDKYPDGWEIEGVKPKNFM